MDSIHRLTHDRPHQPDGESNCDDPGPTFEHLGSGSTGHRGRGARGHPKGAASSGSTALHEPQLSTDGRAAGCGSAAGRLPFFCGRPCREAFDYERDELLADVAVIEAALSAGGGTHAERRAVTVELSTRRWCLHRYMAAEHGRTESGDVTGAE